MTMPKIMEGTIQPIIAAIKAGMMAQLNEAISGQSDARVNLVNFKDYLIYPKAIGLESPCLFVLGKGVQFRQDRGQNHINALVTVQVSAVYQDRSAELLTILGWRYHDVLHKILDRAHLVSSDERTQNVVRVTGSEFGDTVQIKEQTTSPFRQELMLVLEVDHMESEN